MLEALGYVTCIKMGGSPDQLLRCLTHAHKLLAALTRVNTASKRTPPPSTLAPSNPCAVRFILLRVLHVTTYQPLNHVAFDSNQCLLYKSGRYQERKNLSEDELRPAHDIGRAPLKCPRANLRGDQWVPDKALNHRILLTTQIK